MHDEDAIADDITARWIIQHRSAHRSTDDWERNARCTKSLVIHGEHAMTRMGKSICLTEETVQVEILGALHAEDFMKKRRDLKHHYRNLDVSTFLAWTWTDGAHVT